MAEPLDRHISSVTYIVTRRIRKGILARIVPGKLGLSRP